MEEFITVKGARQHNLKNVDIKIPRNQFVVITGVSGSGKSSLAFDTIYAEGQRRYVESLSSYARQFLDQLQKPDLDSIDGLSPAVAIEQKSTSRNPRSTVGTITEIYDYLRLLFARIGKPYCYNCGKQISSQTKAQILDQIITWPEGTKLQVTAPLIRGQKGEYKKLFLQLKKDGFSRVLIDGKMTELEQEIELSKNNRHDIDVVIDRIVLRPGVQTRLSDSLEVALKQTEGLVKIIKDSESVLFSSRFACVDCGVSYTEIEPRIFSFNSPHGACPTCHGLGVNQYFDPDLVIPDHSLSILEGAIAPWGNYDSSGYYGQILQSLAKFYKFKLDIPFQKLPDKIKKILLEGSDEEISVQYKSQSGSHNFKHQFKGVLPVLQKRYLETSSESSREDYTRYLTSKVCEDCNGARLKKQALFIKINELNINQLSAQNINQLLSVIANLKLNNQDLQIAKLLLKEITNRLTFLKNVGLEYLTLSREAGTLSGGEAQRIRLATQIGSNLMGVIYILDEPSIGLHQRDNEKLINTLKSLRDKGNTVLVVEHDEDTMLACDYLIDIGPGAGIYGGQVVAQGKPDSFLKKPTSLTGRYLSGELKIAVPKQRKNNDPKQQIKIEKVSTHNLKNVSVSIPKGLFTCVTGVSGSGKSSLIIHTLLKEAEKFVNSRFDERFTPQHVKNLEGFKGVLAIDQTPIGRTPRSNPATYTDIFGPIRELFAATQESKVRGYKSGRFSFNVKGGRCDACDGDGTIKIEMNFLPDVYVQCETCRGSRYNAETLEIIYKSKNISQVLDMSIDEASDFFQSIPSLNSKLQILKKVGLGYLKLGQYATTLSGGEAQRLKLSRELGRRSATNNLYVLDEPTTGLHFEDVKKLVAVLQELTEQGNTLVVIEHNLDVIKCADYLIDIGPEGGDGGGQILCAGTPEEVALEPNSHTGRFLKKYL